MGTTNHHTMKVLKTSALPLAALALCISTASASGFGDLLDSSPPREDVTIEWDDDHGSVTIQMAEICDTCSTLTWGGDCPKNNAHPLRTSSPMLKLKKRTDGLLKGKFYIVETKYLTVLMTHVARDKPDTNNIRIRRTKNGRAFFLKVLDVLLEADPATRAAVLGPDEEVKASKCKFAIRFKTPGHPQDPFMGAVEKLHRTEGRNTFLHRINASNDTAQHTLVVTPRRRRRLVERRPIHRLYNQILDANGL